MNRESKRSLVLQAAAFIWLLFLVVIVVPLYFAAPPLPVGP